MSQHTLEGQGHEKLGANRFGVTTQGISVATIIYVTTSKKHVATQIKDKPKERVVTEKREATTEEATKAGGYVATKLSMSRPKDQFGPEFWGSTTQLMK